MQVRWKARLREYECIVRVNEVDESWWWEEELTVRLHLCMSGVG